MAVGVRLLIFLALAAWGANGTGTDQIGGAASGEGGRSSRGRRVLAMNSWRWGSTSRAGGSRAGLTPEERAEARARRAEDRQARRQERIAEARGLAGGGGGVAPAAAPALIPTLVPPMTDKAVEKEASYGSLREVIRDFAEAARAKSQATRADIASRAGEFAVMKGGLPKICFEDCARDQWIVGVDPPDGACHATCCIGCTVVLAQAQGTMFLGYPIPFQTGASQSTVLWGRRHDGQHVYIKFQCIAGMNPAGAGKAPVPQTRAERRACVQNMRKSASRTQLTLERHRQMVELSVRRLQHACGLEDLGVDVWVENVVSSYPYHMGSFPVRQPATFLQPARGVSVNTLFTMGKFSETRLKEMVEKIDSEEVRKIAVHDLLFSESDRHNGNVFLDVDGKLTLIDNDMALGWHGQAVKQLPLDSIFTLNTNRYTGLLNSDSLKWLDYRCHTGNPEGTIGKNYPPSVEQCMQKFVEMSPEDIQTEFQMPLRKQAEQLRTRSADMLRHGFEAALSKAQDEYTVDKAHIPRWYKKTKTSPSCRIPASWANAKVREERVREQEEKQAERDKRAAATLQEEGGALLEGWEGAFT